MLDIASSFVLASILVAPALVPVPVGVQMVVAASSILYFGSVNSLTRETERKSRGEIRDVIASDQAYRFPLTASVMLLSLFLAFKYLPEFYVSLLLTLGSVFLGTGALAGHLARTVEELVVVASGEAARKESKLLREVRVPVPAAVGKVMGIPDNALVVTGAWGVGVLLALPVGAVYFFKKHWLANNVLAAAIGLTTVELLAVEEFKTAAIMLSGLFFYDVFWVFGSKKVFGANVMVTVAKKFDGPIKLWLPKFPGATRDQMSLLGLGDIALPGIFVALMYRFDNFMLKEAEKEAAAENAKPGAAPKIGESKALSVVEKLSPRRLPYFYAAWIAYIGGLVATYVALRVFNAAQPALLYLVPFCLLTVIGLAMFRGELAELLEYNEAEVEADEKVEGGEESKDDSATEKEPLVSKEPKKDK